MKKIQIQVLESRFWLDCDVWHFRGSSELTSSSTDVLLDETFRCRSLSHVIEVSIMVMIPNYLAQWGSCRISIGGGVLCPGSGPAWKQRCRLPPWCLPLCRLRWSMSRMLNCCSANRCLEPLVWSNIGDVSFVLCSLALVRSGRFVQCVRFVFRGHDHAPGSVRRFDVNSDILPVSGFRF